MDWRTVNTWVEGPGSEPLTGEQLQAWHRFSESVLATRAAQAEMESARAAWVAVAPRGPRSPQEPRS